MRELEGSQYGHFNTNGGSNPTFPNASYGHLSFSFPHQEKRPNNATNLINANVRDMNMIFYVILHIDFLYVNVLVFMFALSDKDKF